MIQKEVLNKNIIDEDIEDVEDKSVAKWLIRFNKLADEFHDITKQEEKVKKVKKMNYKKSVSHAPYFSSIINDIEDVGKEFAELVEQKLTYKTPSIWYPKVENENLKQYSYIDEP